VIAVAATHHRFLWIHPFLDGNGRVARLMSHAMLLEIGIGSALWSVSRGLARNSADYKRLLMAADEPRRNDLDGCGALSHEALIEKRLLVSASHKAPLRLGFPIDVVESWFPKLYPAT
jgi:Fic family protein